jgi:hypothetical protein
MLSRWRLVERLHLIRHEDRARRGVLTALTLQRTLAEANLGEPHDVECRCRLGLNSGLWACRRIVQPSFPRVDARLPLKPVPPSLC